jgi:murein L,D-transpeptidase YcbB/YkuD
MPLTPSTTFLSAPARRPSLFHRSSGVARSVVAAGLLAVLLLPLEGCRGGTHSLRALFHHRKSKSKPNTTDYADNVATVVSSSHLASLRWANYSDYQPEVQQFYDDRNYELAWVRDGQPTPAAMQIIALFTDAAKKGLNPEDYDASRWPQRQAKLADILKKRDTSDAAQDAVAEFDAAMTISAMRFLSDIHVGRINPQALNFDIDVPKKRAELDLPNFVDGQLIDADDVASVVATLEPKNPMYTATEQALPRYLELAKQESQTPLEPLPAAGKGIAVGGSYAAMGGLVLRLQREGDGSPAINGSTYTSDAAAAVKHFQQRHGITADGKLNDATVAALNVPMSARVQQLSDSLERWRWLPENYQQPRVLVNLPEFLLRAYGDDHSLAFTMRVVDGEAKGNHDTPTFVRLMRYVVFRPYWNLPPSIVKKEIVPHLQKSGMGYLDAHGYELTTGSGTVVPSATVADIEHLRYAVRQRPGPKNSLGLVKFLFPNEYDVYMHSTPELNLFSLTRRDRSHGCVRLQHADQMAQWVLSTDKPDGDWDEDKVTAMMTSNLKTPVPVAILYLTANVDEDGNVDFFDDIYGYDRELEAALAKGRPYPKGEMKINPKLTPGETE